MTRYNPYTLATLTYLVAERLGGVVNGRADSGSGNTLVDARLSAYPDDHFNGGVVWILDEGGSPGGHGGQVDVVGDFESSTGTITVGEEVLNPVPTSLVNYAVCTARYNLYNLRAAVNRAIESLGKIVYVRTADYTTVAAQTEYSLVEQTDAGDIPVVIDTDAEVIKVEIQTKLNDSNDNQWRVLDIPWQVVKSNPGTMNVLELAWQPPTGYALRVTMLGQHPFLNPLGLRTWTELDQGIPFQLVVVRACRHILSLRHGGNFVNPRMADIMSELEQEEARLSTTFAPLRPKRQVKTFNISNPRYSGTPDEFYPIP
jgi:hypothetical protein